ncbi:hypothetical protein IQ238_01760 [Pleurocapsales cyanobacterium LEGE 06147]|nr:hypothetical protein [Pleurocapsales cyanobacterium LEGE 06147]
MSQSIAHRLEQYTSQRKQEVLIVTVEISGEADTVLIYNGFSSSLMRSTSYDPDVPVIPPGANIIAIDRLTSPYNPAQPNYIQQGLTWEQMESLLLAMGI